MKPLIHGGYDEPRDYVRTRLLWMLDYSRQYGVSFTACLAEARRQFNKEVREDALTRPMPAK